jgi:nucleoside-diphosphate-sugar epimerase
MRVLVAGATSVPGLPLLRELNSRGHEVIGVTRSPSKTSQIQAAGAKPVVADVFDADEIDKVVADVGPEVVVSLLTTLPKWGPKRPKDFEPAKELWSKGAPNLVRAAQRNGVRRVVAESVVFAYGYPMSGPPVVDETDLRRAQRHRGNRVALRHLLRSGCAARRIVHASGEVVGTAGPDR